MNRYRGGDRYLQHKVMESPALIVQWIGWEKFATKVHVCKVLRKKRWFSLFLCVFLLLSLALFLSLSHHTSLTPYFVPAD